MVTTFDPDEYVYTALRSGALHLSLSTVKTHLASVQGELSARNRVEIAAWAWRNGHGEHEQPGS